MRLGGWLWLLILGLACTAVPAQAYDPKHPKVQALVERAVQYLEGTTSGQFMDTLGGKAVRAYAIYKHRKNPNHPAVQEVVQQCDQVMQTGESLGGKEVYMLGFCITLLTELNDAKYDQLIAAMYQRLLNHQKENGSWTYGTLGDTSVTQYAILASWAVKEAQIPGAEVPQASIEKACNWLMRVQDPSGAWPYLGKDPGNFTRIEQERTELSVTAAALGSLYITADMLDFRRGRTQSDSPFVSVRKKDRGKGNPTTTAVDHQRLWDTLGVGDRYWAANVRPESERWQYYYMYSIERYESFKVEVLGQVEPKEGPAWYNAGVEYLEANQAADGSWETTWGGPVIDTSFAVLYLLRSTRDKIHPATSGILLGGNGIPDNFRTAVQTEDGQVVAPEESNRIEDLAAALRQIEAAGLEVEDVDLTALIEKPVVEKSELDVLRENLVNEPNYQKRLLSVRVLAGRGGLENAPVLIFALSDPDNRVVREARNALRRISRKVGGFGLGNEPDEQQKIIVQRQWAEWLQSVRPDLEVKL